MISGVDLLPTLLDVVGVAAPAGLDGRSFAPLLRGESQAGRDMVVTEYNENSGGNRHPMRSIITRDFAYIFSPWSNGQRKMATATMGTITYRRMQALAATDSNVAARLDLFEHRLPEELYNYATDHDALRNLANIQEYHDEYNRLTKALEEWMVKTNDPMLGVFRTRHDLHSREAFMAKVEQEAKDRNKAKTPKKTGKRTKKSKESANAPRTLHKSLIRIELPKTVSIQEKLLVKIDHTISIDLQEQLVHITLKDHAGNRIERQVVSVSGTGSMNVGFDIPRQSVDKEVSIAVFIGEEFSKRLQQENSKLIPVTSN
jgi:N-sulfoglucosamine sulfohydrolase